MAMTLADIERAYREHAARLQHIVAFGVRAPAAVIEDACQVAWSRLVDHRHRIGADTAVAWVLTTAVRDALREIETNRRTCSIDAIGAGAAWPALQTPGVEERVEHRQRLDAVASLPVRQQRLLWLAGMGFSYTEMAAHEGCTARTVERQLLRGRHTLADAAVG